MKQIAVAAAVIQRADGAILIAKRPLDKHQGGLWEFPGGKIESGESALEALDRELVEEVGVRIEQATPLIRIHHDYLDKSVLLDVWRVTQFSGSAAGLEGQEIRWVTSDQLRDFEFPAANQPIITAAQLPDLIWVVSDGQDLRATELKVERLLKQGYRWLMLKDTGTDRDHLRVMYQRLMNSCRAFNAHLLLNTDPLTANTLNVENLFLTAHHLVGLHDRSEFSGRWLGAACHNPGELLLAQERGCDFVSYSPVASGDHPLGWLGFQQVTEKAVIPVYARGGLSKADLAQALQSGAQGLMLRAMDV